MNNKLFKIIVLALPIVAMGFLIGLHSQNRETGKEWRIPVAGYDPRDLLRGHYLTFRYDWNWLHEHSTSCRKDDCALCLEETDFGDSYNPKVQMMSSRLAKGQCRSYIRGYSQRDGHFEIGNQQGYGLRRYYIPEEQARLLDTLLRRQNENGHKFVMGLRVNDQGHAVIEHMYIDGIILEEWLRTPYNEEL